MRALHWLGVACLLAGGGMVSGAQAQPVPVAIAMFGPHPTMRLVADKFKEELAAEGIVAQYDEQHVNFDRALVPQLLTRLASQNPAVMLTITTPLTQSAKQVLASRTFPIVFAPVTDPVHAGIVASLDHGDALMTGASNMPDLDATCEFIKTLTPATKRLAILYNPGDDSDVSFATSLEEIAPRHGLTLLKVGVDNANDIPQRVQSVSGRADAIFLPASSLLQPASAAIASVANRLKIPVFNSEPEKVKNNEMLAAYSVDWAKIGTAAGKQAASLLRGAKAEDIPIWRPAAADHDIYISDQRMKALGLALPPTLANCNCVVE